MRSVGHKGVQSRGWDDSQPHRLSPSKTHPLGISPKLANPVVASLPAGWRGRKAYRDRLACKPSDVFLRKGEPAKSHHSRHGEPSQVEGTRMRSARGTCTARWIFQDPKSTENSMTHGVSPVILWAALLRTHPLIVVLSAVGNEWVQFSTRLSDLSGFVDLGRVRGLIDIGSPSPFMRLFRDETSKHSPS